GFQATRSICRDEATRHIPVVLVTTKDQDTARVWGMRQGARAYITKPFNEADLGEVISQLLPGGGLRRGARSPRTRRASVRRPASGRRRAEPAPVLRAPLPGRRRPRRAAPAARARAGAA